jgi:hypothetical protein
MGEYYERDLAKTTSIALYGISMLLGFGSCHKHDIGYEYGYGIW